MSPDIGEGAAWDLKGFLRSHGFRFFEDNDRGAVWTNGVHKVNVRRNYDKEPGQLRRLMEEVKAAENRKRVMKEQDAEHAARVVHRPSTPEEHHRAQLAAAPILHETSEEQPKEPAPVQEPTTPPTETGETVKRRTAVKYKGEERLYVFGRLRALIEAGKNPLQIVEHLKEEGIKTPKGARMNVGYVNQMVGNWRAKPDTMKKYQPVREPRQKALPSATAQPVREPQPAPAVASKLPAFITAILREPTLSDKKKVAMVLAWAEEAE